MSSTYLINRDVGDIMELFEGNNYRINIVGSDSSIILDSWSGQLTANVVTNYGTVLLDIEKETFGGSIVDQNNSIVLDNLNKSYYGNVFTPFNEIIVDSNNKTLHGDLHGNIVSIHNEIIVDAETGEVTATFISGNLITKTGEIAFDPELHLFKGTFQGQFVDGFGAVVVDSDTNEFFGNLIGSVYDTDKQIMFDCYEKKISNVDIYSRNIFSKDGLLLIDGEAGEIRGDIYGGNIYDVNNQLMIDSVKHIVYSQVQGSICDADGEPILNVGNRELVNTNIKGGIILSSYSDPLIDCNNSMVLCDVNSTNISAEFLTAGLANIKKISASAIETNEVVPTILEVYFNNTCNMACLYCGSHFSTKWEEENKRFGVFEQGRVRFGYNQKSNPNYERMLADFWKYLEDKDRYRHIRYYQILGGEPFFQPEFDTSLDFWESHPNPELTFNIITNLKVSCFRFLNII